MEQSNINILIELLKESLNKPNGAVLAAQITVGGMLSVTVITSFIQLLITKTIIESERNKLHTELEAERKLLFTQLQQEFKLKQFSTWQENFISTIADLLKYTDVEAFPSPEKDKIIPLIHKAQLLLNLDIQEHKIVNQYINQLGLAINGWDTSTAKDIFTIQNELLKASRKIIYLPTTAGNSTN